MTDKWEGLKVSYHYCFYNSYLFRAQYFYHANVINSSGILSTEFESCESGVNMSPPQLGFLVPTSIGFPLYHRLEGKARYQRKTADREWELGSVKNQICFSARTGFRATCRLVLHSENEFLFIFFSIFSLC